MREDLYAAHAPEARFNQQIKEKFKEKRFFRGNIGKYFC
jgi:hypothetical protein